MKKLTILLLCVLSGLLLMQCTVKETHNGKAGLAKNFVNPPDDARIWVFWFWLNSNITREGITADLEAMKRAGVGGVLIMEVDQGAPVGPVAFMSTQWRELFKYMTSEADRLGIEVDMNNDAGWNGSGGPWVPLGKAMQVVVTSEQKVPAGKKFTGILPKPAAKEGFYRDITVLAFPTPRDADNPKYRIKGLPDKNLDWAERLTGQKIEPAESSIPAECMIKMADITDLSGRMDTTGLLNWDAPAFKGSATGTWTVIRFGHTFTGAINHPAPKSGSGPECDKLSPEGIEVHYNGMMAKLIKDLGPLAGKTLTATHVDSWEVGSQNWTPKMREEFKRLRGYDMTAYLPVLTGRMVESPEISERFLRDVRQTVSDLLAVNYIGHLRELAHRDGLRLSMEAYTTPANDQDVGNYVDEPVSEFWWPANGAGWTNKAMSSLSHVNGRPITGAEAFTAVNTERWLAHPANIKALGDKAFCDGINRFIVHRFAMQPWVDDRRPGMTMGPWGLHYERTEPWWEDSKAWHAYVARCQYMLRQGTFVADFLKLQPEEPMTRFDRITLPGYDYDGISPQAFLKNVTVKDGNLVLPSGMKYRLLVLPDVQDMSVAMLTKIDSLVEAGATVLGNPPEKCAGLSGYPESDQKIKQMATKLWGSAPATGKVVGKGKVLPGNKPADALSLMGIRPDFISSLPMSYIHRSISGTEVYFIAYPEKEPADITCKFRVTGMIPEAWNPETGEMKAITVYEEKDGSTRIPLHFKPSGSYFIVFTPGHTQDSKRIVSVKFDGIELAAMDFNAPAEVPKITPKVKPVETRNNFTMAAWVNPENEIVLPKEARDGTNALFIERNDVIYPAPGHEVWPGKKDAGAGFGAGANGICIYEHAGNYFTARLVYPTRITGWTHVAVVYQDNTPSLWINGKMVAKGLKSRMTVHGSIGVEHKRRPDPFVGQLKNLIQFPTTLTGEEIRKLVQTAPDTTAVKKVQPVQNMDLLNHEVYKNGNYVITTANGKTKQIAVRDIPEEMNLDGPWKLSFTKGGGAPDQVVLDKLISWSRHPDSGIKYYSGSALYKKTFSYSPAGKSSSGLKPVVYLDLGNVAIMAEVHLNGKNLGILWNPPYRMNITDCIKTGDNNLEIRVVNLMVNRMIGDEELPDDSDRNENGTLKNWPQWLLDRKASPSGRYTFTTWRLWPKDSPLQTSGLLGPVTVQTARQF